MKAVSVVLSLLVLTSFMASASAAEGGGAPDANAGTGAADTASNKDIDDLEAQILGSKHTGDSVKDRLDRLEKKAFGKVSSEPDQEERICRLKEYQLCKPTHSSTLKYTPDDGDGEASVPNSMSSSDFYATERPRKPVSHGGILNGSSTFTPQSDISSNGSEGIIDKLNRLERQILGKTQSHKPLTERVADLEAQVFPGKDFSSQFIDTRINRLSDVIGGSHGSGSSRQSIVDASRSPELKATRGHPLMHSIGHAFTEAGGAAMSLMGALGTSNLYYSGGPFGYDPYGMGGMYSPYGTSLMAPGGVYGALGPYGGAMPYAGALGPYGGAMPYAGALSPYYGMNSGLYGGLAPYGLNMGLGSPIYSGAPGTIMPGMSGATIHF